MQVDNGTLAPCLCLLEGAGEDGSSSLGGTKSQNAWSLNLHQHMLGILTCCYSIVGQSLLPKIWFPSWTPWCSTLISSLAVPGKADLAVSAQDQAHAWTVKLLITESARMMTRTQLAHLLERVTMVWSMLVGMVLCPVATGPRAKFTLQTDLHGGCITPGSLILIKYSSGNTFIKNSIELYSSGLKSIIKQKEVRIIPGYWVLHKAFKILLQFWCLPFANIVWGTEEVGTRVWIQRWAQLAVVSRIQAA